MFVYIFSQDIRTMLQCVGEDSQLILQLKFEALGCTFFHCSQFFVCCNEREKKCAGQKLFVTKNSKLADKANPSKNILKHAFFGSVVTNYWQAIVFKDRINMFDHDIRYNHPTKQACSHCEHGVL
mmetsp:Transcript_40844/g.52581  ORF Transcript_40844/g.52581 Transcript_40844/m.52581 type:complete len:125 (+) Transcript_40844:215-589(+)